MDNEFLWDNHTKVIEKIDGSLVLLFWYNNWRVTTRGSFAEGELNFSGHTWGDWIWGLLDPNQVNKLDQQMTYVFEFVSPYNKVVQAHADPALYLLTIVRNSDGQEMPHEFVDALAKDLNVKRPRFWNLDSPDSILGFLTENGRTDPTFEGFVVVDKNWRRMKFKSEMYINLHHLVDNGNLFNPNRLVPLVLNGEIDEVVAYLPEIKPHVETVSHKLNVELEKLTEIWLRYKDVESQKDFALSIVGKTPFTSILFNLRKKIGLNQTYDDLKAMWRDSSDAILKSLF